MCPLFCPLPGRGDKLEHGFGFLIATSFFIAKNSYEHDDIGGEV